MLIVFIAPLIFLSVKEGSLIQTLSLTAVFALPIAFLYIYSAEVSLCEESIEVRFPFGTYQMYWEEIQFFSRGGGNIKFIGAGKTLTLPSIEFWHGRDLIQAINMLNTQANRHEHKEKPGYLALIPTFHRTKNA